MVSGNKRNAALRLLLALAMGFAALAATSAKAQFVQVNLVGDVPGSARHTDPNLHNGWGMAFLPGGPFWVSDNFTGLSSVYDAQGNISPVVVTVPAAIVNPFFGPVGSPAGVIANTTAGFAISANGQSGPAMFLFATNDGTISGWNPNVNPTKAIIAVDNSASFAIYTGLAMAVNNGETLIYAADADNNKVDVFDQNFNPVALGPNAFTDPNVPAGLTVYGIQRIEDNLYVTFASATPLQGGVVDVFGTDGTLIKRISANGPGGPLEGPWAMVIAPGNFGPASKKLLVGDVDDGHINIFNPKSGVFLGQLKDTDGNTIAIDGLWALVFGGGQAANGVANHLYFASGPNNYNDGLFGVILPPSDSQD
jgi:uncharacterized protein (TIGR03118 family)